MGLSSSHERNYLQPIPLNKRVRGMTGPRHELQVDLDGHLPRRERQLFEQSGHGRAGRDRARLAIADDMDPGGFRSTAE
jgi:hypothetical protein